MGGGGGGGGGDKSKNKNRAGETEKKFEQKIRTETFQKGKL
jgi:hypothetical protein